MRRELYEAIVARLVTETEVRYVDLWNQNVEFIEQEQGWERPAVFVEFEPVVWERTKERVMETRGRLRLHVVTDWMGSSASGCDDYDESLGWFDLLADIRKQMESLSGESFGRVRLEESHTNHNHEELLENIEVYSFRGVVRLDHDE